MDSKIYERQGKNNYISVDAGISVMVSSKKGRHLGMHHLSKHSYNATTVIMSVLFLFFKIYTLKILRVTNRDLKPGKQSIHCNRIAMTT